jgi:hypothetical protein
MNAKKIAILTLAASLILAVSGCLEETATPKIAAIKPGEISNYVGQKVGINLTPDSIRDSETYNFYYKIITRFGSQKRSIYGVYKVYDTKEGVKLATTKPTRLAVGKSIIVTGTIKEDDYTPGNLIIYVEKIIERSEPSGEI